MDHIRLLNKIEVKAARNRAASFLVECRAMIVEVSLNKILSGIVEYTKLWYFGS